MSLELRQQSAAYWRIKISNPPLNLLDPELLAELLETMVLMEAATELAVVVFESGVADYFMAHVDLARVGGCDTTPGSTGLTGWSDLLQRLEQAPFISIGLVRGRARGIGSELLLAMDLRFASRERAVLGQPEVGWGLVPGGGALERLPHLIGRGRALEVIIGAEDYSAETAERYGWINQAVPDTELDAFVERISCRLARFGRPAVARVKAMLYERAAPVNRLQLADSHARFLALLSDPRTQPRLQQLYERGLQQDGLFERDLGSLLGLQ